MCAPGSVWQRAGRGPAAVQAGHACGCVWAALVSCEVAMGGQGCTLPGGGKGVRKQKPSCAPSPAGTCQPRCLPCEPAGLEPRELLAWPLGGWRGTCAERLSPCQGRSREHPTVSGGPGRPGSPPPPAVTLPGERSPAVAESPSRVSRHGQPQPHSRPTQPGGLPPLHLSPPSPLPSPHSIWLCPTDCSLSSVSCPKIHVPQGAESTEADF